MVEIAGHQVRAAAIELRLTPIAEVVHPAMFEESAYQASHPNVLAHAFYAGTQARHATNYEVDLDACPGGSVQRVNKFFVHQAVHFEDQMAAAGRLVMTDLALYPLEQALAQVQRCDQEAPIGSL